MFSRLWSLVTWMPPKVRHYVFLLPLALVVSAGLAIDRASGRSSTFDSRGRLAFTGRITFAEGNPVNNDMMAVFGTQLELLTGEELRERAMIRLRVESPDATVRPELAARIVPRTTIFELTTTAAKPTHVQRYLDLVMEEYIGMRREQRLISSRSVMDQISSEIARLDKLLAQQETELFNFKQQRNIVFWEQQSNTAARFLSQLKNREAQLRMELKFAELGGPESGRDEAAPRLPSVEIGDRADTALVRPAAAPTAGGSNFAGTHRQRLRELENEMEDVRRTYLPKHPTFQKLEMEITREKRMVALLDQEAAVASKGRLAALQNELSTLQTSMGEWEQKALESGRIMAEHQKLEYGLTRTRELYQRMVASLQNIDFRKGVDDDMVQILQRASKATENKPSLVGPLRESIFLGVLAGLGLIWLAKTIDRRAFSAKEIAERLEKEVIIEIPKVPANQLASVAYSNPDCSPAFIEAMRGLRGALILNARAQQAKVIVITSTAAAEGKSTISLNLAQAAAESGLNTLVVDADLRRGTIATRLGTPDKAPGLANIIRGEKPWRECVQKPATASFSVITGGTGTSGVVDRLVREFPHQMISEAQKAYDLVIFDAPPLMPVRDADTLLPIADHVVFVVKVRGASLDAAELSMKTIKRLAKVDPLLVVNQSRPSDSGSSYYYYYGYR